MLALLNNLSVKIKFGISLLIPILGLLFYSTYTVLEKNATVQSMEHIKGIAESTPEIGAYIHTLQVERGTSANFIGSKGAEDSKSKLTERRRLSNEAQKEFEQKLTFLLENTDDVKFTAKLSKLQSELRELSDIRTEVSDLSLTVPEMAAHYSNIIAHLIEIVAEMPHLSDDGKISNDITSLIALLQAKENAGIERVVGSAGFTTGAFDTNKYQQITSLISKQESYFWIFQNYATPELKSLYADMINDPASNELGKMRAIIKKYPETFNLAGISGQDFFNTSSARLDQILKIEILAENELIEDIHIIEDTAVNTEIIFLITTITLLVISVGLGTTVAVGISRSLSQLVTLVTDTNAEVHIDADRKDEIGILGNSVLSFRNDAIDNSRIKVALDNCQANVMVADVDLNIIYMNGTMVDMMRNAESDMKKDLPNLDANNLLGVNIDGFHKNPSHQRGMIQGLKSAYETSIEVGGRTFNLIASPILDANGERLGTVVEWDDVTEKLAEQRESERVAAENARVKVALDSCTANVMVANNDFDIIYMNEAVMGMMREGEADIRKDLTGFDTNKLLGGSIDRFHKNPAHQRAALEALATTFESQIEIGGRTFDLIANPINNEDGERLGTVVEWADVTAELAIQVEVDGMVQAISSGDFSKSLDADGKEGFMLGLTNALNSLNKNVSDVVGDVAKALSSLSGGDLTHEITTDYTGMYETLKQDVNQTSARLSETVGEIVSTTDEIGSASTEISSGSTDLSQRTEAQASSLQETAASMEEMSTTVKQNAESAQQANQMAINATETAEKGGEVVQEAVVAVTGIEEASQKVADIIGVIDEIAFQTNLLALNAAVEAARAGEAGKGFAVVAAEVRTLAQRYGEAAKDIKTLIVEANDQVKEGVTLVRSTGDTLSEIVDSSKRVADIISEIAASSREQASGVEEINTAITTMDEMTQQNAALVEQSSAAARTLEEQAEGLVDLIGFFTTEETKDGKGQKLKEVKAAKKTAAPRAAPKKVSALKSGSSAAVAVEDDDDWSEF
ncbi:methyl-accepting chemotaxis protein [Kiloniella sp.]|uniref:methyl-accepting chemotaxis protein n=1 Tax=Kiloniella sp. TaxID=1938587 RepID=UPI003B02403C